MADRQLNDQEIRFLESWLQKHQVVSSEWPGDLIHGNLKQVLADGVVTEDERAHLVEMLKKLVGGSLDLMDEVVKVCNLSFDDVEDVSHQDAEFVLTGTFVIGPRSRCVQLIESRARVRGLRHARDAVENSSTAVHHLSHPKFCPVIRGQL